MADNEKDNPPEPDEGQTTDDGLPLVVNGQPLSETAIQALREARDREQQRSKQQPLPKEINGPRRDVEPTRYGDWEKDGKICDF